MSFQVQMQEIHQMIAYKHTAAKDSDNWFKQFGKSNINISPVSNILFSEQYFNLNQNTTVFGKSEVQSYFLILTVEGDSHFRSASLKKDYKFSKNIVTLGLSAEDEKYQIDFRQKDTKHYSFSFSKQVLQEYLIEFDNRQLLKKIEESNSSEIFSQISLSHTHKYILEKMSKNPYRGVLQKVYFEICVNELLMALLGDLSTQKINKIVLSDVDIQQLHKAKKILLQDIQNPPTIKELARLSALNTDKLNKGFKTLFDNTILKTLTGERMKIAYNNLQNRDMSVQEIAFDTGYENVSNFITVFKKQYGKTPGQMRKEKSFYWFK